MVAKYIIKKVMKSSLKKKRANTPTLESITKQYNRMLERNKSPAIKFSNRSSHASGPKLLRNKQKSGIGAVDTAGESYGFGGRNFYVHDYASIPVAKSAFNRGISETSDFQSSVKNLIGLDKMTNLNKQRQLMAKDKTKITKAPKKKMLGGLLTAGAKEAAKRYFKSGGRKTTTIMKMFGGARSEAKTDVLSGFKMNTSDQYTKNLFDKSMQRIIDLGRKK